ncbi:MAG: flagellar basal body L-ring protein FlgH [Candidatus Omnitrophica bacterium]|nr:flagellar basal body L-ring protein FlgH [Candidatus Omnitrophota bacterium]MCA9426835.1 flagellar basal body L-ring protein FlgH [Candidatus Omnitrophota bacterium]MCA9432877.1 flagellar basal body L-ring protein FlgH [Candidatus Omnitrophota bacterium]
MILKEQRLWLSIGVGILIACHPVIAQTGVGSGTTRAYGWNQPIQPTTPSYPTQNVAANKNYYGSDPYRPAQAPPTVTQAQADLGSGSLWSDRSLVNSPFDFEPVNTYTVGDHIVVRVQDNFQSREDTRYKNEVKNGGVQLNVRRFFWHDFTEANNNPFLDFDMDANEKYDGSSRGNISSILTMDVPTEVKKVLPDGRLMLEGRTSRIIGRDIRQVLISGIVRPEDVDFDTRTVDSDRVLDMQVKWEGNGPGPNILKPGFLYRLFDYIPLF